MNRRRYLGVAAGLVGALAGCRSEETDDQASGSSPTPAREPSTDGAPADTPTPADGRTRTPIHQNYRTVEVSVESPTGETLGAVTAAIADSPDLRVRGLSETEHLPPDRGMLFVFDSVGPRTFVMRGMDFGIDIVYADATGTITGIHHAAEPPPGADGSEYRYPGEGQYVLEVVYRWTTRRGVSDGDELVFDRGAVR